MAFVDRPPSGTSMDDACLFVDSTKDSQFVPKDGNLARMLVDYYLLGNISSLLSQSLVYLCPSDVFCSAFCQKMHGSQANKFLGAIVKGLLRLSESSRTYCILSRRHHNLEGGSA